MKLGRLFGTDIRVDWTALVLFMIIANSISEVLFTKFAAGAGVVAVISLATALGFFASILAHEFGHVLVARKHGVECDSITLHIFGGVASLKTGILPSPKSELYIAIAGPIVSFAVSLAFFGIGLAVALIAGVDSLWSYGCVILSTINFVLGAFNLLPVYPMDGGRVFRSIVWQLNGSMIKATKISLYLTKGFAFFAFGAAVAMCFGVYVPLFGTGIGNSAWLAILSGFILLIGEAELRMIQKQKEAT